MGIGPKWSSDKTYSTKPVPTGNPDPKNFEIKRSVGIGNYTVLEVNYPGCTNYEGNKILLVDGKESLMHKLNRLDPHFTEDPTAFFLFARFEPTEKGWAMAVVLATQMNAIFR